MRFNLKISNRQPSTPNTQRRATRDCIGCSRFDVRGSTFSRPVPTQRGVALIVTVIMLSVITFLTVAFLALMGREKGSVKVASDQTIARLASDAARDRAQAELLATILATTNVANFDLLVSTNFINWNGFDPGAVDRLTNVNYAYQINNNPLTAAQSLQNLANLFFNPRPPVFITNRITGANEFRFYNDLNRNGRPDRTGFWPMTNNLGQAIFTNSVLVTNYLVGDPDWLGGLQRADLPHSPSNQFAYRYSYLVVPAGKTLDLNYIHNEAQAAQRGRMNQNGTDFFRNEGVGSWELNLAAFLYDLNTNSPGGWGLNAGGYDYNSFDPRNPILPLVRGNAFYDAAALYRYRLNGNPNILTYGLDSVSTLYGINGVNAFQNDALDGYSDDGRFFSTNGAGRPASGLTVENDRAGRPWAGAPQPYHFFTPQDLFNPAKTDPAGGDHQANLRFTDRLTWAGTNLSTYDQTTYYRLLSQLGTDSTPEDPDKLNLNYVNVGGLSATNFIRWNDPDLFSGNPRRGIPAFGVPGSVLFFTNAAQRLLVKYTEQWLAENPTNFVVTFGTNQPFGVANIPVLVSNRFAYTPAMQRILQLAANIYDANNNRFYDGTAMPTVFRPIFSQQNGNAYIVNFVEVTDARTILGRTIRDLAFTNAVNALQPDDLVFGVPLVIGAKKGFPNFNEFSMQNVFQISRKLQVTRNTPDPNARPTATNMMYVIGVSNEFGLEAWNSYATNFNRALDLYVTNTVVIALTNLDRGLARAWPLVATIGRQVATTLWPAYNTNYPKPSFAIPLVTNMPVIAERMYRLDTHDFAPITTGFLATGAGFPQPQWGLNVSNRLQFIIVDRVTQRVLDCVNLNDLKCNRDVSEDIRDRDDALGFDGLWSTNLLRNSTLPLGIFNQIDISMGNAGGNTTDWKDYGLRQSSGSTKAYEIDYFRVFNSGGRLQPLNSWPTPVVVTSLVQQVPFTPTKRVSRYYTWQANDPLVHYMANDLRYLQIEDDKKDQTRLKFIPALTNISLGVINERYQPWGGNPQQDGDEDPNRFNLAVKDPGVKSSDAWDFPTNVFPTVGWLGRVHRGSPWQTIYLKAPDVNLGVWTNWAGNFDFFDAYRTRPATDRLLLDIFTTAFDENATRGQLSINQANLAAWSAVFSGVVALTNISSDNTLNSGQASRYAPFILQPAGQYDSQNTNAWPALVRLVNAINTTRANTNLFPLQSFQHLGDIFAVPEFTVGAAPTYVGTYPNGYWAGVSPALNLGDPKALDANKTTAQQRSGLTDAAYEWLPQQVLSLLRLGDPRFIIYAYGQALHPAENSVLTSGPYFQMCTNYQITAEVATRAVVRVEGSPDPRNRNHPDLKKRYPPHLVVESFNYLAPD